MLVGGDYCNEDDKKEIVDTVLSLDIFKPSEPEYSSIFMTKLQYRMNKYFTKS